VWEVLAVHAMLRKFGPWLREDLASQHGSDGTANRGQEAGHAAAGGGWRAAQASAAASNRVGTAGPAGVGSPGSRWALIQLTFRSILSLMVDRGAHADRCAVCVATGQVPARQQQRGAVLAARTAVCAVLKQRAKLQRKTQAKSARFALGGLFVAAIACTPHCACTVP